MINDHDGTEEEVEGDTDEEASDDEDTGSYDDDGEDSEEEECEQEDAELGSDDCEVVDVKKVDLEDLPDVNEVILADNSTEKKKPKA